MPADKRQPVPQRDPWISETVSVSDPASSRVTMDAADLAPLASPARAAAPAPGPWPAHGGGPPSPELNSRTPAREKTVTRSSRCSRTTSSR
ncbi:MAG: hypothetical protein ACYC5V_08575 [Gemmatimonadaceae bacterium]